VSCLWLTFGLVASLAGPRTEGCGLNQPVPRDSWEMAVIADLPYCLAANVLCADADHDGKREFYANDSTYPRWGYAIEHAGNNQFTATLICTDESPLFECVGDADRDGKTDLFLRATDGRLNVYESRDSFSLPESAVWILPNNQAGRFYATITDLDLDSAREVVFQDELADSIKVYECAGDNRYEFKTGVPVRDQGAVSAQTLDMDGDGVPELAVGGIEGLIAFYEAVGDDRLAFRDTVRVLSNRYNCFCAALAPAPDLDHDGGTELLASSYDWDMGLFKVEVLEAVGADSFREVWADTTDGGTDGDLAISVGDIRGDSALEFAVATGRHVRLYHCTGPDRYGCFWQTDSGDRAAALYDINSDGRDELLYSFRGHTIIREWLPVGVEERVVAALQRVAVLPSVARRSEVVRVTGLPQSAECQVLDASGRVVERLASGVWHPASAGPGAYFVRVRIGNETVARKVLVVE